MKKARIALSFAGLLSFTQTLAASENGTNFLSASETAYQADFVLNCVDTGVCSYSTPVVKGAQIKIEKVVCFHSSDHKLSLAHIQLHRKDKKTVYFYMKPTWSVVSGRFTSNTIEFDGPIYQSSGDYLIFFIYSPRLNTENVENSGSCTAVGVRQAL